MRLALFVSVLILFAACAQPEPELPTLVKPTASGKVIDSSFAPMYFADSNRKERVREYLPVIDSMLTAFMKEQYVPGVVYGLVLDDELIHKGAIGYTNLDSAYPLSEKSVFRVASITKSFTALAVLKLREEGRINIDAPASNYLTDLDYLIYPVSGAEVITVRDLLTHASGLPEDNAWADHQLTMNNDDFKKLFQRNPQLANVPGKAFAYSNMGYAILGKIISNVTRMPFQEYIKKEIWTPLQMNNTYWDYTKVPDSFFVQGYSHAPGTRWTAEALQKDEPDGSWGAMGGMLTSVSDFVNYMRLQIMAWPPRNEAEEKMIKRNTLRDMQHPHNFVSLQQTNDGCRLYSYGFGLFVSRDCQQKVRVGHSGALPGYGSDWQFLPEYGIGIIAMGNKTYVPMDIFTHRVLDTLVQLAQLQPRQWAAPVILNERKNQLMSILPGWEIEEELTFFSASFFIDNPIGKLKERCAYLFDMLGPVQNVTTIVPKNKLSGTFVIEGENAAMEVYFSLTPENPALIQEVSFSLIR